MMKTAVTVLQEMMIKMNEVPKYECIAQSGPQHQATFEYRVSAQGVAVTGQARSKKEAKQEAARRMLQELTARGLPVPAPYAAPPARREPSPPSPGRAPALPGGEGPLPGGSAAPPALDARSYVAVLRELCEEYRLGEARYELVGDTGPPHLRRFTVCAALGLHSRTATATTKKQARQLAAEQLYTYLRENLGRLTKDFVEEEALQRAQEKSTGRARAEAALARLGERAATVAPDAAAAPDAPWRPDLGQRVAHYQRGDEACERGLRALLGAAPDEPPEHVLRRVCQALGVRADELSLNPGVAVVRLAATSPPLSFAGRSPRQAADAALRYLRRTLVERPPAHDE
ncbi:uncharacterized protein LOC120623681 [Pararge aegeria]|uniref:uncharacterized protein LOC120623681 n=1 Tax=Pararge aegeria TaxID=116150 RepID=UPI0019D23853|nr:uncharacterized protein LOC120623681 [Pararge aegeria]XP_039745786.1 uncharacterized protein LOC120623681 [Pararge aegeria]